MLVNRPSDGVRKSALRHAMEQTFATKVGRILEDGNNDFLVPIASGVGDVLKMGQLPVEGTACFGAGVRLLKTTIGCYARLPPVVHNVL